MKTAFLILTALTLSVGSSVAAQERMIIPPGLAGPLAGTMLAAEGADAPAAIIIPGSGPTDRNGNGPLGLQASSYRMLAEGLMAQGVSTLRIDKRGMFASSKAISDANAVTLDAYADDALAWAADLRSATGQRCVWLIGHSEGGIVALIATSRSPRGVCGLILIASPGRPLGKVLHDQLHANPANAPILPQADAAIATLEKGERYDTKDMHPALVPLFAPAVQGFLISLFAVDPAALARASKLPLLIISGQEDLQVSKADSDSLSIARPDATLLNLLGMNHVLKTVPAGDKAANIARYSDPNKPLASGRAEAVASFMRASH
ncbi:MAG: alpha/beta hydrolase [Sphingomonadaceae bacterium]